MAYLKPQSPLIKGDDYFYPLTTADQIIMSNGLRMEDMVGKTKTQTITLYQNGWSTQAPYCYSITVKELNDRIPARVYPVYPSDVSLDNKIAYKEELSKITNCERDGMIMTFECWEDVPAMDLVVEVEMNVLYPLEGSINMDDIEPLLPKLNYSIVGGTTEPTNPTKNMIWVQTEKEITNWVFNQSEPTGKPGMVWFKTGATSKLSLNSLIINNVEIDEIFILNAYQYIDEIWTKVFVKIYQNNKWKDLIQFLYNNGDEITDLGGSWKTHLKSGTITKNTNHILMTTTNKDSGVVSVRKSELIDITDYKYLTFEINVISSNTSSGIVYAAVTKDTSTLWSNIQNAPIFMERHFTINDLGQHLVITIPIDALDGNYYIDIGSGFVSSFELVQVYLQ